MDKTNYYQGFDEEWFTSEGYADYQERFFREMDEIVIPTVLEKIQAEKGWRFLDVGGSLGANIVALEKRGFDSMGTEISEYCLTHSPVKEKMIFGECFAIPFPDKSFDVVICMDVFMYLTREEILKSIKELARVASKYVVFSTIDKDSDNASQELNPDPLRNDSVHLFSKQDYIDLFGAEGVTFIEQDIFPTKFDLSVVFRV